MVYGGKIVVCLRLLLNEVGTYDVISILRSVAATSL